jgi:hypothetical protein
MKKVVSLFVIVGVIVASTHANAIYNLSVSMRNADDTPSVTVTFPGIDALVLGGNLWIVSPQHIHITYESHETTWAMRIITKNNLLIGGIYPKPLGTGPDLLWEWVKLGNPAYQSIGGVWQTGDDIVSYGGLICESSKSDPNARAPLAWQVFRHNDPYYPDLVEHVPPLVPCPPATVLNDANAGGGPIDAWAYMGDVGDTGYVSDPTNDYYWVAYGSGGFSLLAQHPVVYTDASGDALPKPGGGEIIVHLGARFGLKGNDGVTDIGVLPAGNYNALIYLELFHE